MSCALSVVLPVHDQADHIERVVRGHVTSLRRAVDDFELVLVPNACRDRSPEIAEALSQELAEVRSVPLSEPGWGRAVRAGLAAASGETLCYANSARTSSEVLALVAMYARVFPEVVVKANRKVRDNWFRRLGSLLYNLEARALLQTPVWDINGTPKAFPRSFGALLQLTSDDDLLDLEFVSTCARFGYAIVEVPVLSTMRLGGASTTGIGSALRLYVGAVRLARAAQTEDRSGTR